MSTITIGVDLAKHLFSVCEMDGGGHVLHRQELGRDGFGVWLAQVPAGTVVAMEACSGAHHWARRCVEHGLQPRLMAAQFVTPFRKNRTAKNDRNDAEAIATAARQGNMRFVPVKAVDQQARLAWHRVREGYKAESLAIGNRLRGLLAEFGVVVAPSGLALRRQLADLEAQRGLPAPFKALLRDLAAHWFGLRERLDACDARIGAHARGRTLRTVARPHRHWPDHRRCGGGHDRRRPRVQAGAATGRLAGLGADAALQRWARAPGQGQLPRRRLPAHVADPGRP